MKPVDLGIGLSFDDVLLVPEKGKVVSREEVDTSVELYPGCSLTIPIISANMDTVTEGRMASAMESIGAIGVPHRFCLVEEQVKYLKRIQSPKRRIVNIGSGECELRRLKEILHLLDGQVGAVLIDIAHGHSNNVLEQAEHVQARFPDLVMIGGNVATLEGAKELVNAGFQVVKVGVGPGAACDTRRQTGCGVPQLTAIMEAREGVETSRNPDATLIADGGIKTSGDIVKALAFGANAVMLGSAFSGTDETPGEVIEKNFQTFKLYRGMASASVIRERGLKSRVKFVEGAESWVELKGPVSAIIDTISWGLKSGISYLGASNIEEIRDNVRYHRISSNGLRESLPSVLL